MTYFRSACRLALVGGLVGGCGSRAALEIRADADGSASPGNDPPTTSGENWESFCQEESVRIRALLGDCCGYEPGSEQELTESCLESRAAGGDRAFNDAEAEAYFTGFAESQAACLWPPVNVVGEGLITQGGGCETDQACSTGLACRGGICEEAAQLVGDDCSARPCSYEQNLVCAAGQCIRLFQPSTPLVCP